MQYCAGSDGFMFVGTKLNEISVGIESAASIALLLLLVWQIWGSVWNIIAIVHSLFKD